jgi:hypothetical protein
VKELGSDAAGKICLKIRLALSRAVNHPGLGRSHNAPPTPTHRAIVL